MEHFPRDHPSYQTSKIHGMIQSETHSSNRKTGHGKVVSKEQSKICVRCSGSSGEYALLPVAARTFKFL